VHAPDNVYIYIYIYIQEFLGVCECMMSPCIIYVCCYCTPLAQMRVSHVLVLACASMREAHVDVSHFLV